MKTVIAFPQKQSQTPASSGAGVTLFMHVRRASFIAHLAPQRPAPVRQDRAETR